MLDYSKEELESKTFLEITVPEDLDRDLELFQQLKDGKIASYTIELRYYHRDRHTIWISLTTAIQETDTGDFGYCISLIRDISRRKRAEQKFEMERSRSNLMAETAGLGLIDCDHRTKKIFFSDISLRSLGYQKDDLVQSLETFYKLIHPGDVARVQERLASDQSGKWTESLRLKHKDGHYCWFRSNALTFTHEDDGATHTIYAQIDVTEERKRAEAFRNAMELAKASDQAKSQFLANMSHELRTPLNPIIGLSELMMNDGTSGTEEVRKMAKMIKDAGRHMLSLIENTLDFTHLQNGKPLPDRTNHSLSKLFSEVELMLKPAADAKFLNFSIAVDAMYDEVVYPVVVVRQIALNLLNNAIKFTDKGAVEVLASIEQEADSGLTLRIEVSDTGIGIPMDKQEIIFEPFEQVDSSNTRKQTGAGLGLAITKKQIELLNGEIGLKSQPGEGSTFTVRIPVELPDKNESQPPLGTKTSATGKTLRIMAVEDQESNQVVIGKAVLHLGHEIHICSTGEEAIQVIESRKHFDLILMDLKMPGMDGFETTRHIQEITAANPIPVVALTANVTQKSKQSCKEAGMDGFIEKPIRIAELRRIFDHYVEISESSSSG